MSSKIELNEADVRLRIARAVLAAGGQNKLADKLGISKMFMSDMVRGHRRWSEGLLDHIGIERATVYYGNKAWKP